MPASAWPGRLPRRGIVRGHAPPHWPMFAVFCGGACGRACWEPWLQRSFTRLALVHGCRRPALAWGRSRLAGTPAPGRRPAVGPQPSRSGPAACTFHPVGRPLPMPGPCLLTRDPHTHRPRSLSLAEVLPTQPTSPPFSNSNPPSSNSTHTHTHTRTQRHAWHTAASAPRSGG